MSKKEYQFSPRKLRKERERTQRRNDIIKIAEQYFTNQGYDNTMVDEIALKAGYSKATIYNYFNSKDDLYVAVVSKAFQAMYQIMENKFRDSGVKFELRTLGDSYLAFIEEYPNYAGLFESGRLSLVIGKMIVKEENNQPMTESEQEFRYHQLKIEKLMIDVVTKTMEESNLQTSLDPFSVVMALSTLGTAINELVMRAKRSDEPEDKSKEYLEVLFNIIDKGLKHYDD